VITIPNERLLSVERTLTLLKAFEAADDVLRQAIQGISDLILVPGLINLDFADVKAIMSGMGVAVMGTGVADGPDRAVEAAKRAVSSPLLEDASVNGAHGVIINITGGNDLGISEVNEASQTIYKAAHPEANIIFGAVVDPTLIDQVKITVIATGFGDAKAGHQGDTPVAIENYQTWYDEHRPAIQTTETGSPTPSIPVRRRSIIPVPAPTRAAVNAGPAAPDETTADDTSPLDVPAFMRRQG
jgi:cell division protein FtsZ